MCVVLVVVSDIACGNSPSGGSADAGAAVYVPTHRDFGGGPSALVGGRLVLREGCLVFENTDGVALPVWPPGTAVWTVNGSVVLGDRGGHVVLAVGSEGRFGGGTDYGLDWATENASPPIPDACKVGNYMLINDLKLYPAS